MTTETEPPLPKIDKGMGKYLASCLELAKWRAKSLRESSYPSDEDRQAAVNLAAQRMMSTAFDFDKTDDHRSIASLVNIRKFLGNLFLPGGVFEDARISHSGYTKSELWLAPMLHLTLSDPGGMAGVHEISVYRVGRIYLADDPADKTTVAWLLERDLRLLASELGAVEHKAFITDVMSNYDKIADGYAALEAIADAGGLYTVTCWGVDIDALSKSVTKNMHECKARPPMYKKMVDVFFGMMTYLQGLGVITPEEATNRKGLLLQAGLEACGRLKLKDDPNWKELFSRVIDCANQPLSPRQSLCFLRFAPPGPDYDRVMADLKAMPAKDLMKAIKRDYDQAEQSPVIRLLGIEKQLNPAAMFRLDGSAFIQELGV
ncbi:hypothetical protein [Pseudomonas sp. PLMAX]|uniref:hypothetical protein n=1 Tax=Pseudomonas sp. PLMAX TaxID=2201998 RepID=UPI0038B6E6C2